ncbi:unnamed protein product [Merluccius merluccius]
MQNGGEAALIEFAARTIGRRRAGVHSHKATVARMQKRLPASPGLPRPREPGRNMKDHFKRARKQWRAPRFNLLPAAAAAAAAAWIIS